MKTHAEPFKAFMSVHLELCVFLKLPQGFLVNRQRHSFLRWDGVRGVGEVDRYEGSHPGVVDRQLES